MAGLSPWNSLEVTKVVLSALTPLLIFTLGVALNQSIRSQEESAREAESLRARSEARQAAVQSLSRFIYERRVRAELLASSLRRNVSLDEIMQRKRQYDEAYVLWNTNHQANLLLIRQMVGDTYYTEFESLLEFHLVGRILKPLDQCLTAAYDARLTNAKSSGLLEQCSASVLIQRALDCGYAFTDELFRASSGGAHNDASETIAARCEQPQADTPSTTALQPTAPSPR